LKEPELAMTDLVHAIDLRSNGAAAHCLLAQVLEARDTTAKPTAEWEACLRYAHADSPPQVEATWLATARLRLSQVQNASH
jgi:hypothetical protein